MCRIWGVSYGDTPEDVPMAKIAEEMFLSLVKGGPHAYGWMQYDGQVVRMDKHPGRCDTPGARSGIRKSFKNRPVWAVGHTRWATHGKPEFNVNNHPIPHRSIVGVHNGKLVNFQDVLDITGREDDKAVVDSEAIFAAVNRWGHAKGLRRIVGDMVAIYTDLRKPHLLHIARSYGRSLAIGFSDKGNVYFASERQALINLEFLGIKFTGFSSVREMRHLVLKHGEIIYRHTYGEVPDIVTPTYRAATRPLMPSRMATAGHTSLTDPWFRDNFPGMRTKKSLEEIADGDPLDNGAVKVNEDCYYYRGMLLTADEYVDVLADEIGWDM